MNIFSHVKDLERNKADKWHIQSLEAQIKMLQELIIKSGLVQKYVQPAERGDTLFRLNDEYYTIKKGK